MDHKTEHLLVRARDYRAAARKAEAELNDALMQKVNRAAADNDTEALRGIIDWCVKYADDDEHANQEYTYHDEKRCPLCVAENAISGIERRIASCEPGNMPWFSGSSYVTEVASTLKPGDVLMRDPRGGPAGMLNNYSGEYVQVVHVVVGSTSTVVVYRRTNDPEAPAVDMSYDNDELLDIRRALGDESKSQVRDFLSENA